MNNEMRDKPIKRRFFPAIEGVFAGLIPGVFTLFLDVHEPFWVTFKVVLLVVAFGIAAANLIGLAVVKFRRSSGAKRGSP